MTAEMYREQMIELFRNPMNHGELDPHTFSYEEDNPLCGDVIRMDVLMGEDGRVADVRWRGDGCAVSQVSASLLTDDIKGKTLNELKNYDKQDLLDLLGIPLSMARMKCALLSLKVLKAGAYGIPDPQEMRKHIYE
jgi:nitrogen fixation NifU-like protein